MTSKRTRVGLERLYRRYSFQVHRRSLRILGDVLQARGVTLEIFQRLARRADEEDDNREWMEWLYRQTTRLCLERLSEAVTSNARWIKDVLEGPTGSDAQPGSKRWQFMQYVKHLPNTDSRTGQVVVHYLLDEMDPAQIAMLMELTPAVVQRSLQKYRSMSEGQPSGGHA